MKRMGMVLAVSALVLPFLVLPQAAPADAAPPAPAPTDSPVARAGDALTITDLTSSYEGNNARYRIPALTTLANGDILAIYDARPSMADLPSHISTVMRRSTDGGATWGEPQIIRSGPAPEGYGDPSVIVDREANKIFVFYAASVNRGYAGSETGTDPTNPNILHPDYSVSADGGRTWEHVRLTEQIKEPEWGGMFAASGEGIQLRTGPHAGRLIQQYTVRYNGANWAMSAYSDDHGQTWQHSELVGPGANENKTVELADGRIMLNSRATPHRLVAYSSDGGQTYTEFEADTELIDPSNNGSIIRAFPDAPDDSPRAQILLFSNTQDTGIRRNLTVKMSCDSGQTWPVRKVVDAGSSGYSTLTPLPGQDDALGGSYGLLYERDGYSHISYTSFTLDWLGGACAPLNAQAASTLLTGSTGTVAVQITNQTGSDFPAGQVQVEGWSDPVAVPTIPAGEAATVPVPVQVPTAVPSGEQEVRIEYANAEGASVAVTHLPVTAGEEVLAAPGPWSLGGPNSEVPLVDLTDSVDAVADLGTGSISVTFSTEATPAVGVLLAASDSSSRTKDLILSLNGGTPYLEVRTSSGNYPARITTDVDVADGKQHTLTVVTEETGTRLLLDGEKIGSSSSAFFADVSGLDTLQVGAYSSAEGQLWHFSGTVSNVLVRTGATPSPQVDILPVLDAIYVGDGDGFLGDAISPWVRITNTGNVPLTGIEVSGPDNSSSCHRTETLAPRESYVCRSIEHTVTTADLAAGSWAPTFEVAAVTSDEQVATASAQLPAVTLLPANVPTSGSSVWIPGGEFASSTMVRVPRAGAYHDELPADNTLRLQTAAGAHASGQLAVSAYGELENLTATVSALTSASGTIPAEATRVRFPSYIPDLTGGGVVADPLTETSAVDIAAGHNQGIWLTTAVPRDTAPGTYTGTVTVTSADGELGQWPISLDVADAQLRAPQERPFVLDMWFHPDAVADYLGLEPWSDAHFDAMRPYLKDLADHGQRVVDVAVVENPWLISDDGEWVPQTYSDYHSAVDWQWDGEEFTFDFSAFDRYVELAESVGIDGSIHVFSMLQFRDREVLTYTDTRTDEQVIEEVTRGGERYKQAWGAFLNAFADHLQDKGWFDKTRLAFDERPKAIMDQAFAVIDEVAPAWNGKTALAANSLKEADIADFISFNYSFLPSVPDSLISQRLDAGKPTLFYTYYNPVTPNTVTASPPVSTRSLGWIVEQRNLDGYLRWTYNSWPSNVYENPSHRYGQGDEYIVYPSQDGPVSSVRWENFRAGQEDAEILDLATGAGEHAAQVRTEALAAVDPEAEGTPQAWANMLQARSDVLDAMSAANGARVSSTMAENVVGRGGSATITVSAQATSSDLQDLTVDFDSTVGSIETLAAPAPIDVAAGESESWQVQVQIPAAARNLIVISGQIRNGAGEVVGQFTEVPLVAEQVSAEGEIVPVDSSSADAQEPVVLEVPLRNRSADTHELTVSLTGSDFWKLGADTITLPAGYDDTARIELHPNGQTGWSTVEVTIADGETPLASGVFDIVSGGVHLSDLEWVSATNGWGSVHRDASVGNSVDSPGNPLSIAGRPYSKGIGVHANSEVVVDVPQGCTTFISEYGIDDEISGGSIVFALYDGETQLWTSELVTPASGAQRVQQDVRGVDRLTLRVTDGGNGNGQDHGDWAGAYFACDVPEEEQGNEDSGSEDSGNTGAGSDSTVEDGTEEKADPNDEASSEGSSDPDEGSSSTDAGNDTDTGAGTGQKATDTGTMPVTGSGIVPATILAALLLIGVGLVVLHRAGQPDQRT